MNRGLSRTPEPAQLLDLSFMEELEESPMQLGRKDGLFLEDSCAPVEGRNPRPKEVH